MLVKNNHLSYLQVGLSQSGNVTKATFVAMKSVREKRTIAL